jgi:cobalamin synthase
LWALTLIAAILVGRWAMVWVITLYPYARAQGAGSAFRSDRARLALATSMAAAILGALAALDPWGTLAQRVVTITMVSFLGLVVALLWAHWASRRLGGGLTGDTYGATNELVELAVLALAPAAAHLASVIL